MTNNGVHENIIQKDDLDSNKGPTGRLIYSWNVHLLSDEPAKLLMTAPVVAISILLCLATFHNIIYATVVLILFVVSLSDYIFPVRYTITDRGASAKTIFSSSTIDWANVKKCYMDSKGIKLSPFENQTRLEAYRGVYLRFGGNRDDVIGIVKGIRNG